ncbi:MAG: ATP-dependent helicase C-terminal domain-containing protein, partial [Nitratireductor sp.]
LATAAGAGLRTGANAAAAGAGRLLLHAWPDRVAMARGGPGRYVLANGRGGEIDPADPLAGHDFLVVADLQGKARNARIVAAAAVEEDELRAVLAGRIETGTETGFDSDSGTVRAREKSRLGAITLAERPLPPPTGVDADRAILDAVSAHGVAILRWGRKSTGLRRRLAWLRRGLGEPWPAMDDAALRDTVQDWLAPFLTGSAAIADISDSTLAEALLARVGHEDQRRVAALAPTHFDAPSGNHIPIDYRDDAPVLAVRVQELFGLDRHPAIAAGTVPLTLELLSPAQRPIQTTRDLPGFWRGSWAEVRAAMRGRYPKHPWPEEPLRATPTARAKPRGR